MRTTAEINLKVNARALGDLEQAMDSAFDPSRVRDTEGAIEGLADGLGEAGGEARTMADSLSEAADTRTDFKRLRDELRAVRQEAKRVNRELERTAKLMRGGGGAVGGAVGGAGGLGLGGGTFRPRPTHTEATTGGAVSGTPAGGAGTGGGAGGDQTSAGYGALAAGLSAIPYAGMALGAFLALGGQAYGSHIGREGARRGTFAARRGGTGRIVEPGAIEGVGEAFGYKPGEAQGMYGQFMSQAGTALSEQAFRTAMGAQQTYGVSLGAAGAMMQAGRRAGGRGALLGLEESGTNMFAEALQRAVRLGLDGSELSTYMQAQTQLISREAELGASQLDMSAYRGAEEALATRVGGFRAQRMTQQFASGVSEIGYRGAGGATEFLLAQEAGYRPGMGTDAYFEALQSMQDIGENPEMMAGYLQRFINPEAGEATNIAMIQRAYSAATGGEKLHADAARAYLSGTDYHLAAAPTAADIGAVRGVHEDLVTEAGFERRRAEVGGEVAGAMQAVTRSTIAMAEAMDGMAPVINLAAVGLEGVAHGAGAAIDMMEPLMAAVQKLVDFIEENL